MPSSDDDNDNFSSDAEADEDSSIHDNDDNSLSSLDDGDRDPGLNLVIVNYEGFLLHVSDGVFVFVVQTGFLFGNIDAEGKLEADILDDECKRQLSTLGRFGFMSMLENVIREDGQNRDLNTDSDEDGVKSPTAEDYSDITELAEDEGGPYIDDSVLMPPPPTPFYKLSYADAKKKLETPLAAMLPSKYANIDVRELFPDFRADKVLSFSRLFGPGKPSSLPQIWRGVKKRRKKKKLPDGEIEEKHDYKEIVLQFGPAPPLDMCEVYAEEKFLKPLEKDSSSSASGKNADEEKGPRTADWRFGPAQLWYDILGVSETGKSFVETSPPLKSLTNRLITSTQEKTLITVSN